MATLVYIFIGVIWGRFAIKKQIELMDTPKHIFVSALLNLFLWPIAMLVAWKRGVLFRNS